MHPRLLTLEDVDAALELSAAAGWNQTAADWKRVIELEPRGCFGIDCDGRLVATATLLCFDTTLAWIGMVLTHRDYLRRGFARALVLAALDEASGRGVRTVKLDATDQGRPLYEAPALRTNSPSSDGAVPDGVSISSDNSGDIPWTLDQEAFGADRSRFIRALGAPVVTAIRGTHDAARRTGPVSRSVCHHHTRGRSPGTRAVANADVLGLAPRKRTARTLAAAHGFQPVRHLIRMRLGPPIKTRDDLVFAIAGFEAG
jgi:GNAT superfamily N-acetyltransferase